MKKSLTILAVLAIAGGAVYGFTRMKPGTEVSSNPTATSTASSTPSVPSTPNTSTSSKKVTINGVTITPLEVTEDSRCAEGLQCIWAGTVKLRANLSKPSGNFETILEVGKPVSTGTEDVTLVAVSPYPKAGEKIAFKDYKFEFKVTVKPSATQNPGTGGCYVGGCSGQLCTEERGAASTCEYTEAYACYKTATCERQPSGQCGWTPTAALNMCLDNAR
jgi:hypothetical protein